VFATAVDGLKPAEIEFRFPSVGATHQILMAASRIKGTTVIRGAAREPEISAVADFLNRMGAEVEGAGQSTIVIRGTEDPQPVEMDLIGDRIETATYLLAGVATGGDVTVKGIQPEFLNGFLPVLDQMGAQVNTTPNSIQVIAEGRPRPVQVKTGPFPKFATDIQAPLMAALCLADGKSRIEENVFEGRYGHVSELCRMGAVIRVDGRNAEIEGVEKLSSAPVEALDIRAGAAVVIGALAAEGTSTIAEPQHLRRGYSYLEEKLRTLGAKVGCKVSDPEDYLFTGC
jgi:UDP-N-acetylglucosamine 1-carboxyvinyltransferase